MQHQLSIMLKLIAEKFDCKFDKGGKPYVLHCLAVMHKVGDEDDELQQMAAGHDLFEDTDVTQAELRELGFSERVINGIMCGTKIPGESYDEYRAKVKSNPDTVKWKMRDLEHNSDIRRLKGVTAKDITRTEQYMRFYKELKEL